VPTDTAEEGSFRRRRAEKKRKASGVQVSSELRKSCLWLCVCAVYLCVLVFVYVCVCVCLFVCVNARV